MLCPYKEFVPFSSKEDLLSKIRFYLAEQNVFERIRKADNARAQKEHTGKNYWHFIETRFINYRLAHKSS